ncbi:MAG: hypothetical protein R3C27_14840 [Hyphomonadaceae bacterium]
MDRDQEVFADCADVSAETLQQALDLRMRALLDWLQEHAPEIDDAQKHLDAGSAEQAYWHYGYAMALRDVQNCLAGKNNPIC